MKWIPHNYQLSALNHLISKPRSALFLDPGLGKTSISLAAARILKYSGKVKGILLIAPLTVCYSVWPNEISKWDSFNSLTHTILHGENKSTLWGEHKDLYIINPEGLQWLHDELLDGLQKGRTSPFDTLWIDESSKFKSPLSSRFEYIKNMLPLFKRRHIMTGTPCSNSLLDLWSQIYILDEGDSLASNFYHYRNKYFESTDWNKYNWEVKDFYEERIHDRLKHLVLDMNCEDHLDMPELVYNDIPVKLPDELMSLYKILEKQLFLELENANISAEAAVQLAGKCHQFANGNVYEDIPLELSKEELREFRKVRKTIYFHDRKLRVLEDKVSELNGKPMLVSYNFQHDLEALRRLFGKNTPYLGSGVTEARKKDLCVQWNKGRLPILLAHPATMGYGLNLQESGHDIFNYSLMWSLDQNEQLKSRIWRQGVKGNQVRIHRPYCTDTIDKAILMRIGEKASRQLSFREAMRKYREE